jgi:thioredoxin reductase
MKRYDFEYLIVGAGPAGLQLGYFFQKNNMDYCILEKGDDAGEFFKAFPRHRKLISSNKVYTGFNDPELNMRWDWNSLISDSPEMLFKNYSKEYFPHADDLVRYLHDFAHYYNLNIRYKTAAENITKDQDGLFHIAAGDNVEYVCKYLVMASGLSMPYKPDFKGIELCDNYFDCSVNPDDYINKRVLIVGKGNSAFETADNLVATTSMIHLISPSPVKFAWDTHYVGHLRAVNNNVLDTYQLKSQNALMNGNIDKIEKNAEGKFILTVNYGQVTGGEVEQIEYDSVIVCCGFKFNSSIFDSSAMPQLMINDRFPKLNSDWESSNVKNLYFAGNITHSRDFKKTTSGFIHGFRYNSRALYHILNYKNYNINFDGEVMSQDADVIGDAIIRKINLTSTLWQQFGFFGDLVVVNRNSGTAKYIDGLPVDFINEDLCRDEECYFIITLEYGHAQTESVFSTKVTRINKNDYERADESLFLHPVVRKYSMGKVVSEQHLIEDFRSLFDRHEHIYPLKQYLSRELEAVGQLLEQQEA